MTVKIDINTKKIISEREERIKRTQVFLDLTIAKDSNYYIPNDTGTLESSVLTGSKMGTGILIWDAEYAKKQYYQFETKSKDKNPNASMKWFERAKSTKIKDWEAITNDRFNQSG